MREVNNQVLLVLVAITLAAALTPLGFFGGRMSITGLYSGITNVSVSRLAAIDVLVALVEFGDMIQGTTNETTNYSPHPFVLKNNGTTFLNITVYSELLWPSAMPYANNFYRVNASDDNATNTALSTLQSGWVTTWINMTDSDPGIPNLATCVNNSPDANTINVHINITVPTLASAGTHTATVTFLGDDPLTGTCGAGT